MDFRLLYRGGLPANGTLEQKQEIRRAFHRQLAVLWQQRPLIEQPEFLKEQPAPGEMSLVHKIGAFTFVPLVCSRINLLARIEILMLRPQEPGAIIRHGGDLDNRLKTLLDSFRMPAPPEIPKGDQPLPGETPFFCLLDDDALVSNLAVDTDRLLEQAPPSRVDLVIRVSTRATRVTFANIGLSG